MLAELKPFMTQYLHLIEILTVTVAIVIALSSIDDVFIDIYYWLQRLTGRSEANLRGLPDYTQLDSIPERPFAIIIPAWKEHEVIFSMLSTNSRLQVYNQAYYFVGVYQNDPLTQNEVRRAQERFPNIYMSVVPRDGPTSKADCLNVTLATILKVEAEKNFEFAGIVMHDSEDLIHPHELKVFNLVMERFDFVQLPVFSFARSLTQLVGGIYMDEFAEVHTKDLIVRQSLSGIIPCAGVSACFSREAVLKLLNVNAGEAFRVSSFTEDYDIAFRISELGLKAAFVPYKHYYTIDVVSQTGEPAVVHRKMAVATREFFPSEVRASYRQRARWLLGIVFQGTRELGWKGSLGTKYFLARDRKGIVTSPAVILGYFVMLNLIGLAFYFSIYFPDDNTPYSLLNTEAVRLLFVINLAFLVWRLLHRMIFTKMIYDWPHALMSAPRLIVANFINFFATMRAVRIFSQHLLTGSKLVWDKTNHSYPVSFGAGPDIELGPSRAVQFEEQLRADRSAQSGQDASVTERR
jgi:adsorption protein B